MVTRKRRNYLRNTTARKNKSQRGKRKLVLTLLTVWKVRKSRHETKMRRKNEGKKR